MTDEKINALARQAARSENSRLLGCGMDDLIRFAHLVANTVRDEDAAICDEYDKEYGYGPAYYCAQAIRARKT